MRKVGGIVLAAILLAGCTPSAEASTVQVPDQMRVELCEHFNAGFTVDDAARVQAELFGAEAGNELRAQAEAVQAEGC